MAIGQSPVQNNPQSEFPVKFFVGLFVLLAIVGGVLLYLLYKGGQLPFVSNPTNPTPIAQAPVGGMVDTSRIENCTAKKETDPLVDASSEVVPGMLEIDFRGKITTITPQDTKTSIKLTSVSGEQVYEFLIDNTEIIYGKENGKVQDLKFLDGLLIATNCKQGEKGNLRISRIYKTAQ